MGSAVQEHEISLWFFPWFWPYNFRITIRKHSNCSCTLHWIIAISSISPISPVLYSTALEWRLWALFLLASLALFSVHVSSGTGRTVLLFVVPEGRRRIFLGASHDRKPWGLRVTLFVIQGCSQNFLGHKTPGYIPELMTAQPGAVAGQLSSSSQLCPWEYGIVHTDDCSCGEQGSFWNGQCIRRSPLLSLPSHWPSPMCPWLNM